MGLFLYLKKKEIVKLEKSGPFFKYASDKFLFPLLKAVVKIGCLVY